MKFNDPAHLVTLIGILGIIAVYLIMIKKQKPDQFKNKVIVVVTLGIIFFPFIMVSVTLIQLTIKTGIIETLFFPAVILILLAIFIWKFLR